MAELIFDVDNSTLEKVSGLQIKANFDEMKAALTEIIAPYKGMIVTADDLPQAKADRAKINKVVKSIDERRILCKKIYTEPLTEFENKCKELVAICKEGVNNLDGQIKAYEGETKRRKMQMLTEYFDANNKYPEYLSIEDVTNPKWVNATYPVETAQMEIDNAILRTQSDIEAIHSLGSKFEELLLTEYRKTHDMTAVLRRKAEMEKVEQIALENAKRQKEAEEEAKRRKEEAEAAAKKAQAQKEESRPEPLPVTHAEFGDDALAPCPVCGSTSYKVVYLFKDNDAEIGCSDCVRGVDAWDYNSELEERAYDRYVDMEMDIRMGR